MPRLPGLRGASSTRTNELEALGNYVLATAWRNYQGEVGGPQLDTIDIKNSTVYKSAHAREGMLLFSTSYAARQSWAFPLRFAISVSYRSLDCLLKVS